jgi:hypothetical protein
MTLPVANLFELELRHFKLTFQKTGK